MPHELAIRLLEKQAADLDLLAVKIEAELPTFTVPSLVRQITSTLEARRADAADIRMSIACLRSEG